MQVTSYMRIVVDSVKIIDLFILPFDKDQGMLERGPRKLRFSLVQRRRENYK